MDKELKKLFADGNNKTIGDLIKIVDDPLEAVGLAGRWRSEGLISYNLARKTLVLNPSVVLDKISKKEKVEDPIEEKEEEVIE